MPRTSWIAVVILGVLALGVGAALLRRPSTKPTLDCPPELVRFRDGGEGPPIAYCGDSPAMDGPAGAGMAVGKKLDLNRASEVDLALIPGVGPSLAKALVERRTQLGGFRSWEDVDGIPGVGAAKIELLRSHAQLNGL